MAARGIRTPDGVCGHPLGPLHRRPPRWRRPPRGRLAVMGAAAAATATAAGAETAAAGVAAASPPPHARLPKTVTGASPSPVSTYLHPLCVLLGRQRGPHVPCGGATVGAPAVALSRRDGGRCGGGGGGGGGRRDRPHPDSGNSDGGAPAAAARAAVGARQRRRQRRQRRLRSTGRAPAGGRDAALSVGARLRGAKRGRKWSPAGGQPARGC